VVLITVVLWGLSLECARRRDVDGGAGKILPVLKSEVALSGSRRTPGS
jgi:hypothetical protein